MTTATALTVEIAVQDADGARVAIDAGASRLELCQALDVGGLTPSLGLLEAVLDAVDPALVNVLVRPRGGGFVYSDEEIAVVAADIRACAARGAGGVVVGALDDDGRLDRSAIRIWKDAAGPATVVFHRAIDAAPDPFPLLGALIEEGIGRVLTSGGAARSVDGIPTLTGLVARGGDEIEIMAGGGVQPADIPAIRRSGVGAVHLSARTRAGAGVPSGPGGGVEGHDVTSAAIVRAAVAAAHG